MKQKSNNEQILDSLDGISRATAPDFFYTRLKARMEKELLEKGRFEPKRPWILRPVFAVGMLVLILLINAAVIFTGSSEASDPVATETNSYQSIAAEYNLNDVVFEEVYK